jgi:predicted nucleic acid-binding protein
MNSSWPICPDANLVVQLLVTTRPDDPLLALWQEWLETPAALAAPPLLFYEVSNALRRYVSYGQLTPAEADAALDAALNLGITIFNDATLHREALALAQEFGLPATYDAHYLALARRLGATFWTADKRLYRSVTAQLDWVRLWPTP